MPTLANGQVIALPTFVSVADVLTSLQAGIAALNSIITNYNPGGVTETYLEGCALGLGNDASTYPGVTAPGAYELLLLVQSAAFALTATGDDLDLKAADVGVTRKLAVAATGPYVFTAIAVSSADTVIPAGTVVSADPADPTALPILFATATAATILAGQTTSDQVQIVASNAGSAGNQIKGAVQRMVTANNVTGSNPGSISGGADTEQDDTPNGGLRARTLTAIADASQCTITAIEDDAKTFAGVLDAVLVENTADDGTPQDGRGQLYIDDGTGDLGNTDNANHALITTVQTAFDVGQFRAAGTQVHVVGSLLLLVTVTLQIQVNAQYALQIASAASVALAVALAIYTYVGTLGIGKPVLVAELVRVAAEVAGVSNVPVNQVIINGAAGDLQPSLVQVPRCASVASVAAVTSLVSF